jgi:hypothetical protein
MTTPSFTASCSLRANLALGACNLEGKHQEKLLTESGFSTQYRPREGD